jgi:NAD(P)-dependent dehydrogenase (short-subunit alcohol dehydrogenase family)
LRVDRHQRQLFDLGHRTLRNVARAAVPQMIAAGGRKIVTVGAGSAQRGLAGMGAYTASKSATIRLNEAMSAELREQRVNVNCVLPAIIDTPENRAAMPEADPARAGRCDRLPRFGRRARRAWLGAARYGAELIARGEPSPKTFGVQIPLYDPADRVIDRRGNQCRLGGAYFAEATGSLGS